MAAAQFISCAVAPAVCNIVENHSLRQTSYMVPSFLKGFFIALLFWLRLVRSFWDHRVGLRRGRMYHHMQTENYSSSKITKLKSFNKDQIYWSSLEFPTSESKLSCLELGNLYGVSQLHLRCGAEEGKNSQSHRYRFSNFNISRYYISGLVPRKLSFRHTQSFSYGYFMLSGQLFVLS